MDRFILLLVLRVGLIVGAGLAISAWVALAFTPDMLCLHVSVLLFMGVLFAAISGVMLWLVTRCSEIALPVAAGVSFVGFQREFALERTALTS